MVKLGILGGMGPMATELLFKMIIENTKASSDQEHIDMIILNHASIPDRTAAIKSGNTKEVFSALLSDIHMLEENGCSSVAIPCNTSHYFYDELQSQAHIPIINMVQSAIEDAKKSNPEIKRIGILATDGTIFSDIYKKECSTLNIEAVYPDKDIQKIVMDIIYNQIKKGEKGNTEDFEKIDEHLRALGCQGAILACTELSCYKENNGLSDFYTDALKSLCRKSILASGGTLKEDLA